MGRKPTPSRAPAIASSIVTETNGLRHRSKARGLLDASNLPALQNLVKRDPAAYTDEFEAQWNHYQSLRRIYAAEIGAAEPADGAASTAGASKEAGRLGKEQEESFTQLLAFVTQLCPCYPEQTKSFSSDLSNLLLRHHASLGPDVRRSAVRSLVLLRNREVISSEELLRTLFPLLSLTTSSSLRSLIQATILSDLKAQNRKSINHRLNRVVQGLLFAVVERGMPAKNAPAEAWRKGAEAKGRSEALWAVRLAAELWRKSIWTDAKTVSLLALACFHPHPKVQSSAVRFFLGDLHNSEDGNSSDGSSDEDVIPDVNKMQHQRKINKKTKGGDRKVRAAAAVARRIRREAQDGKGEKAEGDGRANFAALYLLNDPQGFGERLFENLSKGDKRMGIELKVRVMQLLSRVMGAHKCSILSFYSYVVKYLNPHQVHITLILVSLAQSVHAQTPPDAVLPIVRKLSDNFVHPGVGIEVVAAGINSVREIARRQPWAMEKDLLADLIGYRKSKDKGVAAAARGLLQLYRDVNPALLPKSERGKSGSLAVAGGKGPRAFGDDDADTQHGIAGIELLEAYLEEQGSDAEGADPEEADRKAWEGWELESDSDSDDSGGWIDVSSDEGDGGFDVEDSEDEREKAKAEEEAGPKKSVKERLAERKEKRKEMRRKIKEKNAKAEDDGSEADSEEGMGEEEGDEAKADAEAEEEDKEQESFSKLATTRILTPADFAKLAELRLKAAEEAAASGGRSGAAAKREVASLKSAKKRTSSAAQASDGTFLDEADILGPRKKRKADYEERMASIQEGREGRDKFGSKKSRRDKPHSTTNEQKSKKGKAFAMVSKSWSVRSKSKTSVGEKARKLKKHIDTANKRKGMK